MVLCVHAAWIVSIPFKREGVSERKLWTNDHHDSEDMFLFPCTGKAYPNARSIPEKTGLGRYVSIPFNRDGVSERHYMTFKPTAEKFLFPSTGTAFLNGNRDNPLPAVYSVSIPFNRDGVSEP